VWLSRSTSGRSAANPYGNSSVFTKTGNATMERTAELLKKGLQNKLWCVLEQPVGSLIAHTKELQVLNEPPFFRVCIDQRTFGARSRKPTWLQGAQGSGAGCMQRLCRE
jgi:hypothetical protein